MSKQVDTLFPIAFSNSMLSDLWRCELLWFRKYCQKFTSGSKNPDLIAGGHFAKACELVRKNFHNDGLDVDSAIEIGYNYILEAEDTGHNLKSNERIALALKRYFRTFPLNSNLTPVALANGEYAIEFAFEFDLGIPHPELPETNLTYKGKLDGLYEHKDRAGFRTKVSVLDEKTTTSLARIAGTKLVDKTVEENLYTTNGQFIGYCLTGDHEVLTPDGWVRLDSLAKEVPIMCWDSGNLQWEQPWEYIDYQYTGNLVEYTGLQNILGTPEHRQPVFYRKDKTYRTYTLDTIPEAADAYQFISGGNFKGNTKHTLKSNSLIQFFVAMQADGCWSTDSKQPKIQFCLSKERKKDRLNNLLYDLNVTDYTIKMYEDSNYTSGIRYNIRICDPSFCELAYSYLGKDKNFDNWLLSLAESSLNAFIDELPHWDGYVNKNGNTVYTSTNFNNIQWVQTIASLVGKNGNIQLNNNHIRNSKHKKCWDIIITSRIHRAVSRHKKTYVPYDGQVYCVNVPSSYFLIRYKGTIMVTGNCWAAKQLGVSTNNFLIRKVPIGATPEQAIELDIPVSEFQIAIWSSSTVNKIEELVDKYKFYKENNYLPHISFYPIFQDGCNAYKRPCNYNAGCRTEDGEAILASRFPQKVWDSELKEEVSLIDFKKKRGL